MFTMSLSSKVPAVCDFAEICGRLPHKLFVIVHEFHCDLLNFLQSGSLIVFFVA